MRGFTGFMYSCLLCVVLAVVFSAPCAALEEGDVSGKIEGVDGKFLRDYNTLNYKGEKDWQQWGEGLRSLGWIKVQGASGELKDLFLLVIDTRTKISKQDGTEGQFSDFNVGNKIHALYRMGWDALHAQEVKILE
jgi:hypothetical protein